MHRMCSLANGAILVFTAEVEKHWLYSIEKEINALEGKWGRGENGES